MTPEERLRHLCRTSKNPQWDDVRTLLELFDRRGAQANHLELEASDAQFKLTRAAALWVQIEANNCFHRNREPHAYRVCTCAKITSLLARLREALKL